MSDVLVTVARVGVLVFVVAGMTALGLTIAPSRMFGVLRSGRLVVAVLVANFVAAPLLAVGVVALLPMNDAAATAVLLLGCAGGAPILPQLVRPAHGDLPLAVGVMVLLMVVTVGFAPPVVPLLVEGATVSVGEVAGSLVTLMLLPLLVGSVVRARWPERAEPLAAVLGRASGLAMAVGGGAALLRSWRAVVDALGSGIFVATVLLLLGCLALGAACAPHDPVARRTLALATAQRNISAAIVVAVSLGADVLVDTLVAAILCPLVLAPVATLLGRRAALSVEGGR